MKNKTLITRVSRYIFYALLVCVIFCAYIYGEYNGYRQGLKNGYERGSWATAVHHKYFGNYGSRAYHDKVYESGLDPQDKEDIERMLNAL